MVPTSCESSTLPSRAAHSSTSGSSFLGRLAACTRTMSSSGRRRSTPRRILLLKSSSVANRSIVLCRFVAPGEQAVADAVWVEARFYFSADLVALSAPGREVLVHLAAVLQVVADDGVDVGQVERRVLLDNLLGRGALVEGVDHRIQRDARAPDADHAVGVSFEGDRFC